MWRLKNCQYLHTKSNLNFWAVKNRQNQLKGLWFRKHGHVHGKAQEKKRNNAPKNQKPWCVTCGHVWLMDGKKFESTTHDLNGPSSTSPPFFTMLESKPLLLSSTTPINENASYQVSPSGQRETLILNSQSSYSLNTPHFLVKKWHFPATTISKHVAMTVELLSLSHKLNALVWAPSPPWARAGQNTCRRMRPLMHTLDARPRCRRHLRGQYR